MSGVKKAIIYKGDKSQTEANQEVIKKRIL